MTRLRGMNKPSREEPSTVAALTASPALLMTSAAPWRSAGAVGEDDMVPYVAGQPPRR
jgi:hypothetical protein